MDSLAKLSGISAALGDVTRLRILEMLWKRGETCVCELIEELSMTQSNISFHLNALRHAGLVTDRKIGKWVFYTVDQEALNAYLEELSQRFHAAQKSEASCCDSVYSLCCSGKLPLSRGHVLEMVKSRRAGRGGSTTERKVRARVTR